MQLLGSSPKTFRGLNRDQSVIPADRCEARMPGKVCASNAEWLDETHVATEGGIKDSSGDIGLRRVVGEVEVPEDS